MSMKMEDEIKRWAAKRKSALVLEITQGKTTVAEASRTFDLAPSEIEQWIEDTDPEDTIEHLAVITSGATGETIASIMAQRWAEIS